MLSARHINGLIVGIQIYITKRKNMKLPEINIRGRKASDIFNQSFFQKFIDYMRSITPRGDGKTIAVNRTPFGCTIRLIKKNVGGSGGGGGNTITYPYQHNITEGFTNKFDFKGGLVKLGTQNIVVPESLANTITTDSIFTYFKYVYTTSWAVTYHMDGHPPNDDPENKTYYQTVCFITSEVQNSMRIITNINHQQTEGIANTSIIWQ